MQVAAVYFKVYMKYNSFCADLSGMFALHLSCGHQLLYPLLLCYNGLHQCDRKFK